MTAPAPSGTYWTGTVSSITGYGIVADCGQHNFAQGFGCLPVTTTGATITGTPLPGQYFQMWGDLSNLPNIKATVINYAPTPFSSTAPAVAPVLASPAATLVTATPPPASAPATPVPSGTYWSGTVSGTTRYGIVANCGQHNFAQGFGCLPVTTTGATVSGAPIAGQYFQMWGDLSKLPQIRAYTINYGATQFPTIAPTPASSSAPISTPSAVPTASPTSTPASAPTSVPIPSPAPTAAPIANGASTFMGFANAVDYPTSFTPYAPNSVWNTPVSSHPVIASYSAAVVAAQFPNGSNPLPVRANEAGQWDYDHPRFFASASDPLVNVVCTQYCGAPDNGGVPSQIHIPAQARPANGGDAHFDIVQPDGTEITMWGAATPSTNWTNGATEGASNVANCGSFGSGQGWLSSGPGPTAAGYCDDAGIVTAAELIAGHINHALFIVGACAVGSQYPIEYGASTDQCANGVGPPLGGREWYDVPCATTQADSSLRPWEKAILCALNVYGGYVGDGHGAGGSAFVGITPQMESEEPWYDFYGRNYTSPFAALSSQGWYSLTIGSAHSGANGTRWVGADPWQPGDVNFASHIHWLDPCSAKGTC